MTIRALLLALALAPATAVVAQRPPSPCLTDTNARRFDFWVGEWNVSPAHSTTVVGHSVIQKVAGACALLENWTATNGHEGKSLNAYNAGTGQWQQFWVDQSGRVTEYRESHWRGDTLVLLAHGTTPQGSSGLQRLSFFPIDTRTVRQLGESSTDDGRSWVVQYDFYYHRVP